MSASRHPLNQSLPEVVECQGHLHDLISAVAVAGTEQHRLVVVGEMAVGNRNGGGSHDYIDKSIVAVSHRDMIHPDVARTKDGNAISITLSPEPVMGLRISDHPTTMNRNVVDLNSMDDDVVDELEGEASTAGNVHIDASSINGLVAGHDELLLQGDHHAAFEDDPQWAVTCNRMPESSWL